MHCVRHDRQTGQPRVRLGRIVRRHEHVPDQRQEREQADGQHPEVERDQLAPAALKPVPLPVLPGTEGAQFVGGPYGEQREQRHLQAELLEARRQASGAIVGVVGRQPRLQAGRTDGRPVPGGGNHCGVICRGITREKSMCGVCTQFIMCVCVCAHVLSPGL